MLKYPDHISYIIYHISESGHLGSHAGCPERAEADDGGAQQGDALHLHLQLRFAHHRAAGLQMRKIPLPAAARRHHVCAHLPHLHRCTPLTNKPLKRASKDTHAICRCQARRLQLFTAELLLPATASLTYMIYITVDTAFQIAQSSMNCAVDVTLRLLAIIHSCV